eukprot:4521935-Pyramimonas_sp.AAC.1
MKSTGKVPLSEARGESDSPWTVLDTDATIGECCHVPARHPNQYELYLPLYPGSLLHTVHLPSPVPLALKN